MRKNPKATISTRKITPDNIEETINGLSKDHNFTFNIKNRNVDLLKDRMMYPLTKTEIEKIFGKDSKPFAGHLCILKHINDESTLSGCASYTNDAYCFGHQYPCWLIINEKGLCLLKPNNDDFTV